jgi:hypothetical protein
MNPRLGRLQESEVAPIYFTYINQVDADDVLRIIETQLDKTLSLCSHISEEESLYRYAPENCSVLEVLNDLADTERSFSFRVLWFARAFETPRPNSDQNIAASAPKSAKSPGARMSRSFAA